MQSIKVNLFNNLWLGQSSFNYYFEGLLRIFILYNFFFILNLIISEPRMYLKTDFHALRGYTNFIV